MSARQIRDEIGVYLTARLAADGYTAIVETNLIPFVELEKEQGHKIDIYPVGVARVRTGRGGDGWEVNYTIRVSIRRSINGMTPSEAETAENAFLDFSEWVQKQMRNIIFTGPWVVSEIVEGNVLEAETYATTNQLQTIIDARILTYPD